MSKQQGITQYLKPLSSNKLPDSGPAPKRLKLQDKNKDESNQQAKRIANEAETPLASDDNTINFMKLCGQFKILDLEIGPTWRNALEKEFSKPYFHKLNEFITTDRKQFTIYPEENEVWSWTKLCSLPQVKVVILGQDPYHNPGQAHGLCFSVKKGVKPPPSLMNIYKELAEDIPNFQKPNHGDLTKWATQGVLLLNACLTVRENSPNSHADKGWANITNAAIKAVCDHNQGVVFLLWGAYAQKMAFSVDPRAHHVLRASHPSPLSASRGFLGCKHFSKCNQLLEKQGKLPIDWCLD